MSLRRKVLFCQSHGIWNSKPFWLKNLKNEAQLSLSFKNAMWMREIWYTIEKQQRFQYLVHWSLERTLLGYLPVFETESSWTLKDLISPFDKADKDLQKDSYKVMDWKYIQLFIATLTVQGLLHENYEFSTSEKLWLFYVFVKIFKNQLPKIRYFVRFSLHVNFNFRSAIIHLPKVCVT